MLFCSTRKPTNFCGPLLNIINDMLSAIICIFIIYILAPPLFLQCIIRHRWITTCQKAPLMESTWHRVIIWRRAIVCPKATTCLLHLTWAWTQHLQAWICRTQQVSIPQQQTIALPFGRHQVRLFPSLLFVRINRAGGKLNVGRVSMHLACENRRQFSPLGTFCVIREIKHRVYSKRQTWDSSWKILKICNEQIKTA